MEEHARNGACPLELRQLRVVVAAASHRSLRQAAECLHVKQSTVSRSIRAVEAGLGVQLFERSAGGTRTTRAGAAFVDGARILIDAADDIVSRARADGHGEAGRLVVGAHSSLSAGHLRATLAAYREKVPDVSLHVAEGSRDRLLVQVRAGLIDVAIVAGERSFPDLEGVPVWSDRIVAALSPAHPLGARGSVYWTDLAAETLILTSRDPGPELEGHLLAKLASPDRMPRIVRHDVTHATLAQLAGADLGVALMCETSAELGPHIRAIEVRDRAGPSGLAHMAYVRRGRPTAALHAFLRLLRQRYPSRFGSS